MPKLYFATILRGLHSPRYLYMLAPAGPRLEAEGLDIGVVTAIAAPAALEVVFQGDGGHAGAQLMPLR